MNTFCLQYLVEDGVKEKEAIRLLNLLSVRLRRLFQDVVNIIFVVGKIMNVIHLYKCKMA